MRLSPVAYAERKSVLPKNLFLAAIYIIVLVFIIMGVVSFFSAWKITHPGKITTPQITSNIAPDYRNISFYGESTGKLNGWFFDSIGSKNAVLMVHGYGKNRLQFDQETFKLIARLKNEGLNVMAFDLRGSGNSAGSLSTFGRNETQDVLSAIKFLKQQGMDHILLMGFTTGASTCLSALSQTPYRDSIIGVIGDSPYASVDNYVDYIVESSSWLPEVPFKYTVSFFVKKLTKVGKDMDVIPQITSIIPTPILLIDGNQQELSSSLNTKLIYEMFYRKSPVPAHYWNSGTEEYGQGFLTAPEAYMDEVSDFIKECINDSKKNDEN